MNVAEIRYNLNRMWGKYGFKEIHDNGNGIFLFRFSKKDGMDFVVENGPWLVNNKPLIVQNWDIHMCVAKTEPKVLPIWIQMNHIPLEVWTSKGISALASRIGKPLVIDNVIASMCKSGLGRVGYARVLVEVDANKELPEDIEIVYKECGEFRSQQEKC